MGVELWGGGLGCGPVADSATRRGTVCSAVIHMPASQRSETSKGGWIMLDHAVVVSVLIVLYLLSSRRC